MSSPKLKSLILLACMVGFANAFSQTPAASANEKKADYLERIYFSGRNKEGLKMLLLTSKQEMEQQPATESVAKQYTFLSGLNANVEAAEDACDILEMIAAGIFQLDAIEAASLGVSLPGVKAKAKSFDALSAVSKIGGTMNNVGTSASNTALQSYILSGGKANILSSASKIAGAANTATAAAGAIGGALGTVQELGGILKDVGILGHKDKPCKKVPQKDIAIGEHIAPPADVAATEEKPGVKAGENTETATLASISTKITIKNTTYNLLTAVKSALEKVDGIIAVNSDDYSNNTGNLTINTNLKIDQIIDKIQRSNQKINFKIESVSPGNAVLEVGNR